MSRKPCYMLLYTHDVEVNVLQMLGFFLRQIFQNSRFFSLVDTLFGSKISQYKSKNKYVFVTYRMIFHQV